VFVGFWGLKAGSKASLRFAAVNPSLARSHSRNNKPPHRTAPHHTTPRHATKRTTITKTTDESRRAAEELLCLLAILQTATGQLRALAAAVGAQLTRDLATITSKHMFTPVGGKFTPSCDGRSRLAGNWMRWRPGLEIVLSSPGSV